MPQQVIETETTWGYEYAPSDSSSGMLNPEILTLEITGSLTLSVTAKSAFINVDYAQNDPDNVVIFFDKRVVPSGLETSDVAALDALVFNSDGTPSLTAVDAVDQVGTATINQTTLQEFLTLPCPRLASGLWALTVSGEVSLTNNPLWSASGPNVFLEGVVRGKQTGNSANTDLATFVTPYNRWNSITIVQSFVVNIGSSPILSVWLRTTATSNAAKARKFRIELKIC